MTTQWTLTRITDSAPSDLFVVTMPDGKITVSNHPYRAWESIPVRIEAIESELTEGQVIGEDFGYNNGDDNDNYT